MPLFFKAFRAFFRPARALAVPALLLAGPGCAGFRPCGAGDTWLGADKFEHFAVSGGLSAGFAAAWHAEDPDTATAAGLGAAMIAGAAKEWHDLYRKDTCWSWKDLLWDFLGASAGAAAAAAIAD